MPSSRALRVIARANADSVPERCSAITTATSLADFVMRALIAVFTVIVLPRLRPSLLGAIPAARRDTRMRVFNVTLPESSASNSMYSVMILVSEAG